MQLVAGKSDGLRDEVTTLALVIEPSAKTTPNPPTTPASPRSPGK
jgi:hypothetical protein